MLRHKVSIPGLLPVISPVSLCHRECMAQVPQAFFRPEFFLWCRFSCPDQKRCVYRQSRPISQTHRQFPRLIKSARPQPRRVNGNRNQNSIFLACKKGIIPPRDCLRVKVQIFPAVFIFYRCHRLLCSGIIADQGNTILKAPLPPQTVRTVLCPVTQKFCAALFAGRLPDKMQFRHTACADQRALRQHNLAAYRTTARKQQTDQAFFLYNSDFITSCIRIRSPV